MKLSVVYRSRMTPGLSRRGCLWVPLSRTSMMSAKRLYDEDIVAWSKQQAEALRSAAHAGSNLQLDWENLAEEIEDLGVSQRSAVGSYVMRIIQHLVKLDHSPAVE